jgi:hypothetical protein
MAFAGLALLLASHGIYGILALFVGPNTRPRSACAWPSVASRGDILKLVLLRGMDARSRGRGISDGLGGTRADSTPCPSPALRPVQAPASTPVTRYCASRPCSSPPWALWLALLYIFPHARQRPSRSTPSGRDAVIEYAPQGFREPRKRRFESPPRKGVPPRLAFLLQVVALRAPSQGSECGVAAPPIWPLTPVQHCAIRLRHERRPTQSHR